jgi:ATP-binding cassette subfamily C protein LapB
MASPQHQLAWAFKRLAQAQNNRLDHLRFNAALDALPDEAPPPQVLAQLCQGMGMQNPQWLKAPDPALLPCLAFTANVGWVILTAHTPHGNWEGRSQASSHLIAPEDLQSACAVVDTGTRSVGFGWRALFGKKDSEDSFISNVYGALRLYRRDILEACVASVFIGLLTLVTSLFSMQVYDRVIPTRSGYTLIILASGVLLAIILEFAMKHARAHLMDPVVVGMDSRLSRAIFSRLLNLRLDQIPPSVGSLAGQVRGYEQVRGFYTASTLFTLVDLPLALLFVGVIMLISSPIVAAVPLVFGLIALWVGLTIRARIMQTALDGAQHSNLKTGILVETVEGIETIKSGAGGWKFLSRWINVNQLTIQNDLKTRHLSERVGYLSASIQQISYAGLVVAGAYTVMEGQMTIGALIACSILSGRVLAPVMAIPGLLVQQAHARAALEGLEKLYELKTENHAVDRPLTPDRLRGQFTLNQVAFSYGNNPPALTIESLSIQPGERIAILGAIGSGKSTLLRLLSGMYQPTAGRVLVDNLIMAHLHRQVITEHIGYLQQEHRLFQGTLRENLLIGMTDPGDDAINAVMSKTGMDRLVAAHPQGLERMISEGGKGLSGGQKQLVAFTRLILLAPPILLLDEPTATMDDSQERQCLQVLQAEAAQNKTMVIVTHKPSVLPLVTRLIVMSGSQVVIDGPRDAVLQKLRTPTPAPFPTASSNPEQPEVQAA